MSRVCVHLADAPCTVTSSARGAQRRPAASAGRVRAITTGRDVGAGADPTGADPTGTLPTGTLPTGTLPPGTLPPGTSACTAS